jgi:hypothetical protein
MLATRELIREFEAVYKRRVPHYSKFYGMDNILRRYLHLPQNFPLDVHLDHGIAMNLQKVDVLLSNSKSKINFVDNHYRKELAQGKKNVYVLGPLFFHYRRLNKIKIRPDATGTIVYPTHSTHHISAEFDYEEYCKQLKQLPAFYHPITICMYWVDILRGKHQPFLDYGFKVITNGHMFDKDYAKNFYKNLIAHKYSTGNEPGSFTFYSVEVGIPFFLYGPKSNLVSLGTDPSLPDSYKFSTLDFAKRVSEAFTFTDSALSKPIKISEEQREIVEFYIDRKHWISREKALFIYLKTHYKPIIRKILNKF